MPRVRGPYLRLLWICLALLALASFLLLAPVVLHWRSSADGVDWSRLGNVGEVYGGAAAILGILTLGGVVISLLLQAKESRAAREEARRTFHNEIIFKALDDPVLLDCLGEQAPGLHDVDQRRQHVYTNLIVSFWNMTYELGKLSDRTLGLMAQRLFASEPGHRYWSIAAPIWRAQAETRQRKRFVQILDGQHAYLESKHDDLEGKHAEEAADA